MLEKSKWCSVLLTDDKNQKYVNIPSFIFHDRDIAALEAVVVYLKDSYGLNYAQIANLLNRDDRTIWTTYQRAKKKLKQTVEKQTRNYEKKAIGGATA